MCVLKVFWAPEEMGMTELMMAHALRFVLSSDQCFILSSYQLARLLIFVSQEQDSLDTGSPCPVFSLQHFSLHCILSTYLCRFCNPRREIPICHCFLVLLLDLG